MMVKDKKADGFVSGAINTPATPSVRVCRS